MSINTSDSLIKSFIDLINLLNLKDDAVIILIGGNDNIILEFLLKKGYKNITVLDDSFSDQLNKISQLGKQSSEINWVLKKVFDYVPNSQFDLWCDCNTFFLLNEQHSIKRYVEIVEKLVSGFIIINVFSEYGFTKQNGLVLNKYSEYDLLYMFKSHFVRYKFTTINQATSYNLYQQFLVSVLKRKVNQIQ